MLWPVTGDHDQHRPYEDLAVRHVMGSLDPGEAGTFRSHLLDCGDCRARVGELRAIASDLATVERDERRERAAQKVETRQREAEQEVPPPPSPARTGRVVVVVGILLVIILSSWNFVLRGQNDALVAALEAEAGAAATINFGEPWDRTAQAAGVEGIARVEQGALAVMVRGTDDRATYEVTLYDAEGAALSTERVESRDQQVRYFTTAAPADAERVAVTLDRTTGETVVFRAEEPAQG